jgi:hypothetical protein
MKIGNRFGHHDLWKWWKFSLLIPQDREDVLYVDSRSVKVELALLGKSDSKLPTDTCIQEVRNIFVQAVSFGEGKVSMEDVMRLDSASPFIGYAVLRVLERQLADLKSLESVWGTIQVLLLVLLYRFTKSWALFASGCVALVSIVHADIHSLSTGRKWLLRNIFMFWDQRLVPIRYHRVLYSAPVLLLLLPSDLRVIWYIRGPVLCIESLAALSHLPNSHSAFTTFTRCYRICAFCVNAVLPMGLVHSQSVPLYIGVLIYLYMDIVASIISFALMTIVVVFVFLKDLNTSIRRSTVFRMLIVTLLAILMLGLWRIHAFDHRVGILWVGLPIFSGILVLIGPDTFNLHVFDIVAAYFVACTDFFSEFIEFSVAVFAIARSSPVTAIRFIRKSLGSGSIYRTNQRATVARLN